MRNQDETTKMSNSLILFTYLIILIIYVLRFFDLFILFIYVEAASTLIYSEKGLI